MAMLPFAVIPSVTNFVTWINLQRSLSETPRVFSVSWFREDADGKKFLWPRFGENIARP
jgi:phosphoenolpyruvate carboxykinase (GTP)